MTGFDRVEVVSPAEAGERRRKARADFERACLVRYGYVPFNEEFFERTWPDGDSTENTTLPALRDSAGHDA